MSACATQRAVESKVPSPPRTTRRSARPAMSHPGAEGTPETPASSSTSAECPCACSQRAISRVVLNHRERAVLLEPRDKGMVLWTLRYGDEVRDEAEYFKGIKGKPDPKEKKRLAQLIEEHTRGWTPSLAADPVQQALLSMIAAKQKRARTGSKKSAAGKAGNVVDLMAVLKKSLQGGLPQRR